MADLSDLPLNRGAPDPALRALRAAPPGEPVLLLHSGRFDARWAKRSLLARPRVWFRHTADGRSQLLDARTLAPHPAASLLTHDLWGDLRALLHDARFPGRWFGYIAYEVARLLEPAKLPPQGPAHPPHAPHAWPLVELAWCPEVQEYPAPQADTKRSAMSGTGPELAAASPKAKIKNQKSKISTLPDFRSNFTRAAYKSAVRRALGYISAGDVFQVNLAQRFTADYTGSPRDLFARLAALSPAWYGAYLELPDIRSSGTAVPGLPPRAVCSTSPELFLEVRDRIVTTRPIKGTRPAGVSADVLRRSEKDAAELNMIVDLMRNDLGRVCAYGSVRVPEPRTIESHPTVHHGVATITGRLHRSRDIVDLLRAALPGGSITGAPKVRAMQIIDELEPDPRGSYCGCIGYLSKDEAQLNIAIRTILLDPITGNSQSAIRNPQYHASFSAGGGIVADSDPAAEYEETLTKARAMMQALAGHEG